jgi:hypothetical protein
MPEGKKPLGRPRTRWEDGMRMDLREIGWRVWIGFDWLRIGTECECSDEASGCCATELVSCNIVQQQIRFSLSTSRSPVCVVSYNDYILYTVRVLEDRVMRT